MRRVGVVLFGLNDDMFLSIMTDQTFFRGASPIAVAGLLVTINNQHQVPIFRGYCSDVVSTVLRTGPQSRGTGGRRRASKSQLSDEYSCENGGLTCDHRKC